MQGFFATLLSLAVLLTATGRAAEVTILQAEPYFLKDRWNGECNILLSGPIIAGDAARLQAAVESFGERTLEDRGYWTQAGDGLNLCLNSEGGSLAEGLTLAEKIRDLALGTLVKKGHRCLSACAVAYFGGTLFVDGRFTFRMLEAGGVLGVHAPALSIAGDTMLPAEVVATAYSSAIGDIRRIAQSLVMDQTGGSGMPVELFIRMVSTPPDQFYLIETVGQAGQWEIYLLGEGAQVPISKAALLMACSALMRQIDYYEYGIDPTDFDPVTQNLFEFEVRRIKDDRARRGEEVWEAETRFKNIDSRSSGCRFFVPSGSTHIPDSGFRAAVYWSMLDQERMVHGFSSLMAIPPDTLISDVVR